MSEACKVWKVYVHIQLHDVCEAAPFQNPKGIILDCHLDFCHTVNFPFLLFTAGPVNVEHMHVRAYIQTHAAARFVRGLLRLTPTTTVEHSTV